MALNRTSIDYIKKVKGVTWNPVTGCTRQCQWTANNQTVGCFAKSLAEGRLKTQRAYRYGFTPTFHPERLCEPAHRRKPTLIFVCDMGDLFNPENPRMWVYSVFDAIKKAPQHTYLFLTKFPQSMQRYHFPASVRCWAGVSITKTDQLYSLPHLRATKKREGYLHRWISLEPWIDPELSEIDLDRIEFVAAGSLNAHGGRPVLVQGKKTILRMYERCKKRRIPYFVKKEVQGFNIKEVPEVWPRC